ncbi:hypothetical protein ATK36_2749 [Amycolatopsis sulphurea]|uniref:Uncharacterized protein n=1 Tax=Amycolatopsis sulphurea TaxID=76022 RepID=A0A2A9F959_9PSEU|nr:hypothetical protein [Amycolatopsis sulphurea]PFG47698.1 hypothetical protein ATK36_2749 [Amycolatopsis sulphurea]
MAKTETHQGKGNRAVTLDWPCEVPGHLTFDCPKCSSNVIVNSDGHDFGLINAIGSCHGTVWCNVDRDGEPTRTLHISANDARTATVADHRSLPAVEAGKPHSGHGDAILAIPAGVTKESDGHEAVLVQAYGTRELAVNQIASTRARSRCPGRRSWRWRLTKRTGPLRLHELRPAGPSPADTRRPEPVRQR